MCVDMFTDELISVEPYESSVLVAGNLEIMRGAFGGVRSSFYWLQ